MSTTFARLEYGKLCVSADGPIVDNAESRPLAWSKDFPAALRQMCVPDAWGLGDDLDGIDAAQQFGATAVVAPVTIDRAMVRVAASFCRRSERGEGERGREYWRARFVTAGDAASDPAAMDRALAAAPLVGWTGDEIVSPLAAAEPRAHGLDHDQLERWCEAAVRVIERGAPIGLTPALPRDRFFALAAVLERALPPPVRALFSAGWGLAPRHTLDVALSSACDFPPAVAIHDLRTGAWLARPAHVPQASPRRGGATPRWARFGDHEVQRRVETLRRESAVERRLREVSAWLAADGVDAGLPPELDPGDTPLDLARFTDQIVDALADPRRARGGEALLVSWMRGPVRAALIAHLARTDGSPALRLIAVLHGSDAPALLAALRAHPAGHGPWVERQLPAALDATLRPEEAEATAHAALLAEDDRGAEPSVYRAWAERHAAALALAVSGLEPQPLREQALRALAAISRADEVALIYEVLHGATVPPWALQRLSGLPAWKPAVAELAMRRWKTAEAGTADDRAAALAWLRALDAVPDDLLLRRGAPSRAEVVDLAAAVREERVPAELLDVLAGRALRHHGWFRPELLASWATWEGVLERWPAPVVRLLVPRAQLVGLGSPPCTDVAQALAEINLDAATLEAIGHHASAEAAFDGAEGAAAAHQYVTWCREARVYEAGGVVHAVRWLWDGGKPPTRLRDGVVAVVLKSLLDHVELTDASWRARWSAATTATEQVLLMRLFGGPVGAPSIAQLESLLARGDEITRLRRSPDQAGAMAPFRVCTLGWQAVDVRVDRSMWRPEYRRTLLSGVFAGLDPDDEHDLGTLLRHFATFAGRDRWQLASEYLHRRGRDGATVQRLWTAVVDPSCVSLDHRQFEAVLRYSEGREARGYSLEVQPRGLADQALLVIGRQAIFLHPSFARMVKELGDPQLHDQRLRAFRAG